MALRRPPTTFSDSIDASDLAANSVTASELADNAVDADAIAANAVTTAKILNANITTDKIANDAVDADKLASNAVVSASIVDANITATKIAASAIEVKPHIKLGLLYPAMKDTGGAVRLSDGVTAHSGAYGTPQSDGHSYYYTDIKGSKPIKDPRIGAHFGSQRHMFSSIQKLEQETATHGSDVYSVDGREWIRRAGNNWSTVTGSNGYWFYADNSAAEDSNFFEITGYFNVVNWLSMTESANDVNLSIDGTPNSSTFTGGTSTVSGSPIANHRYVNAHSLVTLTFDSTPTLGIHTVKLSNENGDYMRTYGIELIAQDIQDFTATNATNILTSAGHTLTNGDQIRLTGADLPNGLNATTTYYVIGASGNNFQVSASLGGSAVTFSDDGSGSRTFTSLNNIQIPAQNVVSYGKKFSVSATAQHYNPFAFKTDGSTAWASGAHNGTSWPVGTGASANIDTATSLGLDKWLHSSNYYKPYNGGRVVKWVDSSGNIKTSVTVMPPNARSVGNSASLTNATAKTNASIANSTFYPTMEAGAADDFPTTALSEVAKTYHITEFGNGSANGGIASSATFGDASMLGGAQGDIAYVMDDGLTSFAADDVERSILTTSIGDIRFNQAQRTMFISFIGTGISVERNVASTQSGNDQFSYTVDGVLVKTFNSTNTAHPKLFTVAQNLPYGTHVLRISVGTATNWGTYWRWFTFHQPKKPPIPEDAVVLADYMLMADHVKQTDAEASEISKGVRVISGSRDWFYDNTGGNAWTGTAVNPKTNAFLGLRQTPHNSATATTKINFFGTTGQTFMSSQEQAWTMTLGGSAVTEEKLDNSVNGSGDAITIADADEVALGSTNMVVTCPGGYLFWGGAVATPIHTSSHYQIFETPYTHELVGGDRNMEQTNLVVTADGKTWDDITRSKKYLGPRVELQMQADVSGNHSSEMLIFTKHRGGTTAGHRGNKFHKGIAYAYDRAIILEEGEYDIYFSCYSGATDIDVYVKLNDATTGGSRGSGNIKQLRIDPADEVGIYRSQLYLKRGDYICITTSSIIVKNTSILEIRKID